MESTVPTMQATAQAPSAMPIAAAPSSASQYATSVQSPLQPMPAMAAQAPAAPVYQQAVAPQGSAGNPWQEAFQALSASLNTPQASQAQARYSAYQTPTPQANTQAGWASHPQQVWANQGQPTYTQQASTQAYTTAEVEQLLRQQQAQILQQIQQGGGAPDSYLSQVSDVSLEVLEHFGSEAPALLNNYACAVEDALIEQVGRNQSMNVMLDAASEERAAMNLMLTDPDILADYVNGFFGADGPYPTLTNEEARRLEAYEQQLNQQQARQQFANEIAQQERRAVPPSFQRPQQAMPTPGRQEPARRTFWGDFSKIMDNNPESAWQFLSGAPPVAFQAKMLVQDF